jgi:phage recombination protein Bet
MTSKEVVTRPAGALALDPAQHEWTPAQRAALVQLGLEEASPGDLQVFMHQAQRTGLDPFAKQIYMIARWDSQSRKNKYTIQAAIDGLRIVAERHGQYGGQVGPEWCGEDGVWRDVWVSDKAPVAARVGIIRKDWAQPIYATAMFREYAGYTREGNLTRMWREKPAVMIAKCAEALGLRKAFPQDLSGVYTAEEMTQADQAATEVPPAHRQPPKREEIDWDAELEQRAGNVEALKDLYKLAAGIFGNSNPDLAERIAAAGKAAAEAAEAATADEPVDAEVVDDDAITQAQSTKMHAALAELQVTDRNEKLKILSTIVAHPVDTSAALTKLEATQVIDLLERCLDGAEPQRKLDAVLASLEGAS